MICKINKKRGSEFVCEKVGMNEYGGRKDRARTFNILP